MKRGVLAWAAVVVPMWIVLILCTHWEPVAHDGWGHWSWHRTVGMSVGHLIEFAKGTYVHNNPRLGQVLTLIVYTPGPWHSIITPIVELALFYLLTALALGRWPSFKRADDALLFATIFAMAAVTVPSFGLMLFYRPFTGNYLFGLVINLALLIPYRFHYEQHRDRALWFTPAMFVLGVAAGLCNEHTGPALAAVLTVALVVFYRRGERILNWAVAGLLGLIAGGIALFLAPGQKIRYNGLATEHGTFERIIDRGVLANGRIIGACVLYLLPLVVWIVLGLVARRRATPQPMARADRMSLWIGGALSAAITLTLLASPKQGPRLYLASIMIACAVVAGWVVAQLATRWARGVAAALAACILAFASFKCVTTYHTLGHEFAERVRILDAAPDNSVADIPVYTVHRTRWSVGDDLLIETIRNHVSASFGLALVRMHQRDDTVAPPSASPPDDP